MEVYSRSSWFLLLLGVAFVAATLQDAPDCPTTDKVSCVNGIKCNSDEDCQNSEICCQSPCYTKRCIPNPKVVQGAAETDGPSESDCRPYIEKALKELEIGEVPQTEDKDESIEDVPTVEITDDSSRQELDTGDKGEDSEEAETENEQAAQSVEEEDVQQEIPEESTKSDEASTEAEGQAETDASPEVSEEEQPTDSKKSDNADKVDEAEASIEQADTELLKENVASEVVQEAEAVEESQEETNANVASPEEESKEESEGEKSAEDIKSEETEKSTEEQQSQEEQESVEAQASSEQQSVENKKSAEKQQASVEEEQKESEEQVAEPAAESVEEDEQADTDGKEEVDEPQLNVSAESAEQGGCPPPNQVSCTEGTLCSKHKNCDEDKICCPNHCYRKRCVPGTVPQEELDAESESDESEPETQSQEKTAIPSPTEGGCPSPDQVSCTEGTLCIKHKNCDKDEICCPNHCYRKRCVPGTVPQEELDAESESEESEPETQSQEKEAIPTTHETGCPPASGVSCHEGELCNKHRQCGDDEICCPSKCYRKRCIPGTATSAELAEESEEESEEKVDAAPPSAVESRPDTGCPEPGILPCKGAEFCAKHKQCGDEEICCPNKCYRKVCTPGTATEADLADEESEEDSAEQKTEPVQAVRQKDTGCPEREDIPCAGTKCEKNKQCESGQICCSNKCYRRVCVPGTPGSDEDEESEEASEETAEAAAESREESAEKTDGCPSPDNVPCKDGQRCGDDDDCEDSEICCPNKCYTRKCVTGSRQEEEVEEVEEEEPVRVRREEPKVEVKVEPKPVQKPVTPPPKPVTPPAKSIPSPAKPAPPPAKVAPPVAKPAPPSPKSIKIPSFSKPVIDIPAPEPTVEPAPESVEDENQEPLVEELSLDTDIPTELRPREHVEHLLKLDRESSKLESVQNKVYEETLKELKKVYEGAIKPLEVLYKYRDLSNRHFGDAEIFSKPLILFMGPWSGGKSSIINYLLNNEYNETSLRTGAEPSPAYFNLLMYGDEPEIIDGTELAADFTFSGLQKFGQGLEERLRGVKLPVRLLEKVNIVEIPGILEVRKQVSRVFPFNDACQWFIDRADIIFLVYDPAKLDVGPETEAILDQLKGREHQTRIILNKADQIKPEELMRVQGALIWNISPLMSSPQPPVMYTTSLWSKPYEQWAPSRLLQAQERAFLRDLRTAIDRRVENKIASARRFAVRVRNHAKMVDCYLTTYYNHKTVFGNRKQVANEIIEHPQNYHIYEGLSTLTNISRYDLPDPDVYKDFFKLNPLYEFQQLSATCTYFRGCPINRLDIAIAYDLPELVGTYKRNIEEALTASNAPSPAPPAKTPTKKAPES